LYWYGGRRGEGEEMEAQRERREQDGGWRSKGEESRQG
jgi:hypothetical protein